MALVAHSVLKPFFYGSCSIATGETFDAAKLSVSASEVARLEGLGYIAAMGHASPTDAKSPAASDADDAKSSASKLAKR